MSFSGFIAREKQLRLGAGVCMPSSCSSEKIQSFVGKILKYADLQILGSYNQTKWCVTSEEQPYSSQDLFCMWVLLLQLQILFSLAADVSVFFLLFLVFCFCGARPTSLSCWTTNVSWQTFWVLNNLIRHSCCSLQWNLTNFTPRFQFTRMVLDFSTLTAPRQTTRTFRFRAFDPFPCFTSCWVIALVGRKRFPMSTRGFFRQTANGFLGFLVHL